MPDFVHHLTQPVRHPKQPRHQRVAETQPAGPKRIENRFHLMRELLHVSEARRPARTLERVGYPEHIVQHRLAAILLERQKLLVEIIDRLLGRLEKERAQLRIVQQGV